MRVAAPAVVGLAALAESEFAVPSARPLRGGEAEERRPKVRRHARRELHRANGVRARAWSRRGGRRAHREVLDGALRCSVAMPCRRVARQGVCAEAWARGVGVRRGTGIRDGALEHVEHVPLAHVQSHSFPQRIHP